MAPPLVKRFLIAFKEHKLLSFLLFALILAAATAFALQPKKEGPTTYKAVGSLSFRNPPPIFTTTGQQLQYQGRVSVTKNLLISVPVLEGVKNTLGLSNEQIERIVRERLVITFPEETATTTTTTTTTDQPPTQFITLEYSGNNDPNQTRLILTVFMEEMIKNSRRLNASQLRERIQSLENRLNLVQKDLTAAEEAFYRYISTEGSALLSIQDGSLFNSITNAQTQQRQTQLILDDLSGQINSLSSQLGLTPEQAYTSSVLSADPIIANLRAQILTVETQIQQQQKNLRPEHPTMVQLQKELDVAESLLQQRASELIGQDGVLTPVPAEIRKTSNLDLARQELANQLVALETQREGLEKQLESLRETEQDLRREYEQFPDKQLQQARLVQAVESQRILYQTILAALTDAKAAEAETVSSLAIAQAPYIPQGPGVVVLNTNPLLIIAGGAGVGLLAAAGLIFLLATLDDRLHAPQELRDTIIDGNIPVLGQVPVLAADGSGKIPVLKDPASPYLAFYERIRSNIRRYGTESSKVILVTSINHQEGKSVTAYNLAIASAQAGKRTLLVEADLRSASFADVFDLNLPPESKLEPLRYYASRGDCIKLVPELENLYLLPSPGPQRQAVGILESSELQRLLRDARGRFDLVIIDTPCLSSCNDALLLESLIDAIVLVTRPGITQKSMLNETISQFLEGELPLLGAVINYAEELNITSGTEEEDSDGANDVTVAATEEVTTS